MKSATVLLVASAAFCLTVAVLVSAADEDKTKKPFFGIDANDPEALKQKHDELSEENAKKIFGDDHQLDQLDFTPNFGSNHIKRATKFIEDIVSAFFPTRGPKPQEQTPSPVDEVQSSTTTTTMRPMMRMI